MARIHPAPPFGELTIHTSARWVRGVRDGETVVDTRRAVLVWEPGKKVPGYAFPQEDVTVGAPATREYDDPDLDGYVTVDWDSVDHWYEEDEEIFVHPRDPFVRVDAIRSSRHVRVERDGHVLAESDAPVLVFETGLPTRYYLPPEDVDQTLLEESDGHTSCPYKGTASYHHVVIEGRRHPDLFWHYPHALIEEIEGYLAPWGERVDLIVDGELQGRRERVELAG